MTTQKKDPEMNALLDAILSLEDRKEALKFLRDLLTEKELKEFRNRWLAVRLLDQKVSYKEIEQQTGMSSRTLARIARWLNEGEGGYRLMLDRMNDQ